MDFTVEQAGTGGLLFLRSGGLSLGYNLLDTAFLNGLRYFIQSIKK